MDTALGLLQNLQLLNRVLLPQSLATNSSPQGPKDIRSKLVSAETMLEQCVCQSIVKQNTKKE